MIEIIKNPWLDNFLDLVAECNHSIKITSPYLSKNICDNVFNRKKPKVNFELITSINISSLLSKSLNLDALQLIINNGGEIHNHKNIHSKIYIFDNDRAVITSGNLTFGGLSKNFEYGVLIRNAELINKIIIDFNLIKHDSNTGKIINENLGLIRDFLSGINFENTIINENFELDEGRIFKISEDYIANNLTGWNKEVFLCLNSIDSEYFTLKEINSFENYLSEKFPQNHHVLDKTRQILQKLRDMGLIEFVERGTYRKIY